MRPQVSFIIPHFERPELLQETLRSILNQSITDWEAIVVDDGSTEQSWRRARKITDPRIRFLQRTDGIKGPSRCRNIGWQSATSDHVIFVDSDDLVAPKCAEIRLWHINQSPTAGFAVFPVMLFKSKPGDMATLWNKFDSDNDLPRFLASDPCWHTSSPIWRRDTLQALGGFNEKIMYGDDSDLHIRSIYSHIKYIKYPDCIPDAFVRRTDAARITNSISDTLLDSRMTRLEEGSEIVNRYGNVFEQNIWAGQYFSECEFLLFNIANSRCRQNKTILLWEKHHHPKLRDRAIFRSYLLIANFFLKRFYLVVRVARRFARHFLPSTYFYNNCNAFENADVSDNTINNIKTEWKNICKQN